MNAKRSKFLLPRVLRVPIPPSVPRLALCNLLLGLLLQACSGTSGAELAGPADLSGTPSPSPNMPAVLGPRGAETGPQGNPETAAPAPQQDPAGQRRTFLIGENLKRARRARELKLWEDVVAAATQVLEIDSDNEEARRLLQEAQRILGDRVAGISDEAQRARIRAEIERQRDLIQARNFESAGDIHMQEKRFDEAQRSYQRALLTLKYSPWFTPGSDVGKRIQAKAEKAAKDLAARKAAEEERLARDTRLRLRQAEREELQRRQRKVRRLFERANLAFQHQQYGDSVRFLEEATGLDPLNKDAKDLRELAMRARHDQNLDLIELQWKKEWASTFHDLQSADVTQVDTIKHDLRHWAEQVSGRRPLEFSEVDLSEDPDTAALLQKLESTIVDNKFAEASLEDWVDFYRRATGLNFLVSPKVDDLDDEQKTLINFDVGRKSVRQALDNIASIRPIRWRVKDGVVYILTEEESKGELIPRMYDVREIINPIAQHPGRDLMQKVGEGYDSYEEEEEEPVPIVVEMDKLQQLIRDNIARDSWDREGVDIIASGGSAFVVIQTAEVQEAIGKLLADLRASSGIQVDIESRFLRVEDNFLEDVGIDFRGLGNQASTGQPGLGLQKQGDRSGFGFDDFGQNVSPSEPVQIGSGFEPGIFYDDGGDGDLFLRTENLFDRALGGGPGSLTNAGGLSFQYTYLDDTEIEVILRAVQKQERVEQIAAPRLLVHNTARANIAVTTQFTYIRDFNVEIAQAAAVADPVVDVIRDGIVLDVRPVVSSDQRYILMELRPTLASLALPIPTFTTTLGVGQQISIQLPELTIQKVLTTITVPDGGTLLLGGMKTVQKQAFDSGVPILKDLPGFSFFFSRKGTFNANKKILILLRARVVIPAEHEPLLAREDGSR